MLKQFFILVALILLLGVPLSNAAVQIQQQVNCPYGETLSIQNAGILGLLNAGQTVICITVANHVSRIGDTASVTVQAFGPTLIALPNSGAGAIISTSAALTGCTFQGVAEAVFQTNSRTLTTASGQETQASSIGGDVVANQWGTFTMTGTSCSALVRAYACIATTAITTCGGGSNLYNIVFAVNIATDDSKSQIMVTDCGATLSTETLLTASTTCNNPTVNTVLSGTLALTGTLNVVNSGGQNIAITSWPQLQTILCGATTSPNTGLCATPTINIQNTAGQTFALSGTLNTVTSGSLTNTLTGSITVTNAGGQTISISSWPQLNAVLSGRLTIFDFMCNATNTTASAFVDSSTLCKTPYFIVKNNGNLIGNITMSGTTQHLIIDSWPSLTAAVTNSGTQTINLQNAVGQTFAISGTINTVQSGTVNIVNSGGQTVSISSWPQLQAVLSGTVNVPQTCTTSSHCFVDVSNSGVMTIHQDQACGATIHCQVDMTCMAGTCMSDFNNVTLNQSIGNQTTSNNILLGVIPYNLLLVAIAFFAIMGETKGDTLYWIMCLILSIILIVIRPANSIIPTPFFVGWIFIVLYQVISLVATKRAVNLSGDEN